MRRTLFDHLAVAHHDQPVGEREPVLELGYAGPVRELSAADNRLQTEPGRPLLVTAASLILFGAFVVLASGPQTEVKVFATGLAVGIVLDATVVRGMLLPAFVSLFGEWNWWMPSWMEKALFLPPEPTYH